jgi:hypothetical protein
MGVRTTLNPDTIRRFLALTEKERKQIQENGLGLYCIIVPAPMDPNLLNQFPELHQMPALLSLEYEGAQLLAVQFASLDLFSALKAQEGSIQIPFEIVTKKGKCPIEQYLSDKTRGSLP